MYFTSMNIKIYPDFINGVKNSTINYKSTGEICGNIKEKYANEIPIISYMRNIDKDFNFFSDSMRVLFS